jgi:hypothetical protein
MSHEIAIVDADTNLAAAPLGVVLCACEIEKECEE